MSPAISRVLVPVAAAVAVLLVVVVVWQQLSADPDSAGSADGGAAGAGSPPQVEPGDPGDAGDPADGNLEPIPDGGDRGAPDDQGYPAADGTIAATGFHQYGPTRLAILYTNGVPACYGKAGEPEVEETDDAVRVTIPRIGPPKSAEDQACIEIALMGHVDVTLEAPLGGRAVLDGARDGAPLERQSLPDEDPAL